MEGSVYVEEYWHVNLKESEGREGRRGKKGRRERDERQKREREREG